MTQTQPPFPLHIIEKRTRLLPELLAGYSFMNSRRWERERKTKLILYTLAVRKKSNKTKPGCRSRLYIVRTHLRSQFPCFRFFFARHGACLHDFHIVRRHTIFPAAVVQYSTRRKLTSGPVAEQRAAGSQRWNMAKSVAVV
jgi:hypothetical protein